MNASIVTPTPFFYEGRPDKRHFGLLLIHGFTGSTVEMKPMGRYFHQQGYSVCGPLLKGHGTTPEDMNETNWVDWLASAKEGYQRLKEAGCEHIGVIGLSMGGLLALKIGQHLPVMGIVTLCAPLKVRDKRIGLARYVRRILPYKKRIGSKTDHIEEQLYVYERTPVSCIASLHELIHNVRKALPSINKPVLIVQAKEDETVDPISARLIYERVGSPDKKVVIFKHSSHLITLDREQDALHEKVSAFMHEQIAKTGQTAKRQ